MATKSPLSVLLVIDTNISDRILLIPLLTRPRLPDDADRAPRLGCVLAALDILRANGPSYERPECDQLEQFLFVTDLTGPVRKSQLVSVDLSQVRRITSDNCRLYSLLKVPDL